MPTNSTNLEKSAANSSLEMGSDKKEVQSVRIVLPSTFWLHFRGSQALQKACQMDPKWTQQFTNNRKNRRIRQPGSQHKYQNDVKMGSRGGGPREHRKSSKIRKFQEIRQNGPHGCPGVEKASQRHPKGVQMGPKRCPESMKMTSKRRPQGIRIR